MKNKSLMRAAFGTLAAAVMCSTAVTSAFAVPSANITSEKAVTAEAAANVVYSTDFEDGDVSLWANRGTNDTTVISTTTEDSVSGSTSLLASGMSKTWNGPAFRLDTICKPNTEYYVSVSIKGKWYTNSTMSFQYTPAGETDAKYSNLKSVSGNGWQTIENMKVSFTEEMTDVYVYFEGSTDDVLIDDFSIVEVPAVEIEDIPSLCDAFGSYFKVGTAITPDNLASKSFMSLVERHFNDSLTAGNEMKPDAVLDKAACQAMAAEGDDTNPQVSFAAAKSFLNYCDKNNISVRVHTLVWHSQTPDWFFKENYADDGDWVSPEKMLQRMENYIKNYFTTLTELYPNVDFYACDVVNEAWLDDGNCRTGGGQSENSNYSAWVKVFGDNSFIEPAFTYARKYAPAGCKLYYNDFNEYMPNKTTAIINMATDLKEKGLIDGIGMQSHLDVRSGSDAFPSISVYEKALKAFCETGLDVQITELDATTNGSNDETALAAQADYYKSIMELAVKYSDSISAVIFWGVTDDASWRASKYPLIFGGDYMAKPAYYSIMELLGDLPPVVTTTTSEPIVTTTTTSAEPVTTTTNTPGDITLGDANGDDAVDVSDPTFIMQSLANPDEYKLDDKAVANADVENRGDGITAMDALLIQQYLNGSISSFDAE